MNDVKTSAFVVSFSTCVNVVDVIVAVRSAFEAHVFVTRISGNCLLSLDVAASPSGLFLGRKP